MEYGEKNVFFGPALVAIASLSSCCSRSAAKALLPTGGAVSSAAHAEPAEKAVAARTAWRRWRFIIKTFQQKRHSEHLRHASSVLVPSSRERGGKRNNWSD